LFAIQTGTARDVSFLIDFLPAYLYPQAERKVVDWGIIGISLGGHSAWIVLNEEPRVTLGIPIIGCPDYLGLMEARAKEVGVPFGPYYTILSPGLHNSALSYRLGLQCHLGSQSVPQ